MRDDTERMCSLQVLMHTTGEDIHANPSSDAGFTFTIGGAPVCRHLVATMLNERRIAYADAGHSRLVLLTT